jgi:cation transport regulator ChaC
MTLQKQRRRTTDILLLAIWVFGYGALIRLFAALQRVERRVSGSKRAGAK